MNSYEVVRKVGCLASKKSTLVRIWLTIWIHEFLMEILPLWDRGNCENLAFSAIDNDHSVGGVRSCLDGCLPSLPSSLH